MKTLPRAQRQLLKNKLKNHCLEEGVKVQVNGIENQFIKIIEENFPNLRNEMNTQIKEAVRNPNIHDQNRTFP